MKRKYRRENDISDKNSHKMWFSFIGNNELEVLFGGRIHIVITWSRYHSTQINELKSLLPGLAYI